MRRFLFFLASVVASTAFQLSILIWPQTFQSYAPYVKWLWVITGVLLLIWLISHPSIRRFLKFPEPQQPNVGMPSTVNISPVITVSPHISTTHSNFKENRIKEVKDKQTPNLQLESIGWGEICLEDDIWTANPEYGDKVSALLAEIVNAPSDSREVGHAESVKAQLLVKWRDGSASYSPLPWIDEWYNSVDISAGDRKHVVLLVEPFLAKWCFVANRRGTANFPAQSAIEYAPAPKENVDLELHLIDGRNGMITNKFFLEWSCSPTSSRPEVRLKSGRGTN